MQNRSSQSNAKLLKGVSILELIALPHWAAIILFLTWSFFAGGLSVNAGHSILDTVDPTFDVKIKTTKYLSKGVGKIAALPDGKILVGGSDGGFNSYNGTQTGYLARLNPDGSLDATFNNNLIQPTASLSRIEDIVPLSSGKILIGGQFTVSGDATTRSLARLNADGSLDSTFNYNVAANSLVKRIVVRPNNKILLAGTIQLPAGNTGKSIIQLNEDGSLDTSFDYAGSESEVDIGLQGDKTIVGVIDINGAVFRLNADGSLDSSFQRRSGFYLRQSLVRRDNKILLSAVPNTGGAKILRLNEDGSDDTTFSARFYTNAVQRFALQQDDKLITVINFGSSFGVERLLPDGAFDSGFASYSYRFGFNSLGLQADGKLLLGDATNGSTVINGFQRLNADGTLDAGFNVGGSGFQITVPGVVRGIAVQPNNKIIVAGEFDVVNNVNRNRIARLNEDGTPDNSFQTSTSGTNYFTQINEIHNVALQNDGKMIVSGRFDYVLNNTTKYNLVRLNADGSIDQTFNTFASISNGAVASDGGTNKVAIQSDGKILVAVSRSEFGYNSQFPLLLRFNSDGSRDTTFNPTYLSDRKNVATFDLAIQPDGKILIGGSYSYLIPGPATATKSFVARVNADGSLDSTFQTNEEAGKTVRALTLLPSGKIVTAKIAISTNPVRGEIMRLNADGTSDTSFNSGSAITGQPSVLLRLPNNQILVGGAFTTYDNQPRQNLALLNENGGLAANQLNVNQKVLSLTLDNQGRVLIGGAFTVISADNTEITRSYVARLKNLEQSSTRRTPFDFDGNGQADLAVFNQTSGVWSILGNKTEQTITAQFGSSGDVVVPADYDNDGITDIAVYRPSEGNWYLLQSSAGFAVRRWGVAEDKPVPGDYDGDGKIDIAVWRPSNGIWYVLQSSNNQLAAVQFGKAGDTVLPGADFDGDGRTDFAVYRPSDGVWYWLASGSNNQFKAVQFGTNNDIPTVGDYNGDGKTDLVVFRPSNGVWYQYLSTPTGDYAFNAAQFGLNGDVPVPADYDGDGKTDIAVRRGNVWYLLLSAQGYKGRIFGQAAEQAVAANKF